VYDTRPMFTVLRTHAQRKIRMHMLEGGGQEERLRAAPLDGGESGAGLWAAVDPLLCRRIRETRQFVGWTTKTKPRMAGAEEAQVVSRRKA
jgi:hypothetical protein